jgi:hypothetical protein
MLDTAIAPWTFTTVRRSAPWRLQVWPSALLRRYPAIITPSLVCFLWAWENCAFFPPEAGGLKRSLAPRRASAVALGLVLVLFLAVKEAQTHFENSQGLPGHLLDDRPSVI